MDIFSKRDGPRREDVQAKRLISENAGVIRKLADQISGGGYTATQKKMAEAGKEPQAKGLLIHDLGGGHGGEAPVPYVRISPNNRVVIADLNNGRQLHFLGEIRGDFRGKRFCLATKENGFISPVEGEVLEALRHLDAVEINSGFDENALKNAIREGIGLPHAPADQQI